MNLKKDDPFIVLRRQAEKILHGREAEETDPDLAELLYDLEVHHVELELQNEELRQTQGELEASRDEYYSLFDSAPVGFVTISAKGLISQVNNTFEKTLSPSARALMGMAFSSLIHPEDTAKYSSLLKSLARSRKGLVELRMKGGEGLIYVRIDASARHEADGVFSSWHFAVTDITKQKEAEAALKKARDELELRVRERTDELENVNAMLRESNRKFEELNKDLQDFAFVASHDLQEPLRKVQTFGDILAKKCENSLDEASRDYVKRMQSAAARMKKLLDSLLLYSRVTTKAAQAKPTDLEQCVREALSDLEIMIEEKNARVEVGDLPTVMADPVQMVQLFQNLIGNALKYSPGGHAPHVRIYSREPGDGKWVHEIVVGDSGIGFEDKHGEKIFLPFQRLHGRSSEYEGVGMGLAICKKIVERHGGSITAKSEVGKGSTFIVTLPGNKAAR